MRQRGFLFLLIVLPFVFLSCSGELTQAELDEIDRLDDEHKKLARELTDLDKEYQKLRASQHDDERLVGKLEANRRMEKQYRERFEPAREYMEKIERIQGQLSSELEKWRAATRASFVGRKVKSLKTNSGQELTNLVVSSITDDLVEFTNAAGDRISVSFDDMNEATRLAFGHEPTVLSKIPVQ